MIESTEDICPSDCIQGIYEANQFPSSLRERPVPDYGYNLLNRTQDLYNPVFDQKHLKNDGSKPVWPNNNEFAVCLTHDLDHVSAYSLKQTLRRTVSHAQAQWRLRNHKGPIVGDEGVAQIMRTLAQGGLHGVKDILHRGPDPYHSLEVWRDLEQDFDAKSTFFILPPTSGPSHKSDPEYRLDDKISYDGEKRTVSSALRHLHNEGWEIGLHPTWYTFDNANALLKEKEDLENKIGIEINSVRHHWLHYDPIATPRAQAKAGLKFDSTVGFNKDIGFRRGTCYPWLQKDIEQDQSTTVTEIPLIIQDGALCGTKGLDVDSDIAFEYMRLLIKRVREVGGVLTLLWHPSSIVNSTVWDLYKKVLLYLSKQDAWFATIAELGRWWNDKNGDLVTVDKRSI